MRRCTAGRSITQCNESPRRPMPAATLDPGRRARRASDRQREGGASMAGKGGYPAGGGTTVSVELDLITAETLLTALNTAIYGGRGKKKKKKKKGKGEGKGQAKGATGGGGGGRQGKKEEPRGRPRPLFPVRSAGAPT